MNVDASLILPLRCMFENHEMNEDETPLDMYTLYTCVVYPWVCRTAAVLRPSILPFSTTWFPSPPWMDLFNETCNKPTGCNWQRLFFLRPKLTNRIRYGSLHNGEANEIEMIFWSKTRQPHMDFLLGEFVSFWIAFWTQWGGLLINRLDCIKLPNSLIHQRVSTNPTPAPNFFTLPFSLQKRVRSHFFLCGLSTPTTPLACPTPLDRLGAQLGKWSTWLRRWMGWMGRMVGEEKAVEPTGVDGSKENFGIRVYS